MSREIKFRGISDCNVEDTDVKDGDMIDGQVVFDGDTPYIVGAVIESDEEYIALESWCPIRPETLGQYTGLKDKNGKEIYEGDLVKIPGDGPEDDTINVIEFHNAKFVRRYLETDGDWDGRVSDGLDEDYIRLLEITVIGNIYENPELLNK